MHAHEEGGHDDGHSSHGEHGGHSEPQDFDANIQVISCTVMCIAYITTSLDSSRNAMLYLYCALPSSECDGAAGGVSPCPHRSRTEYRSSDRWHGTYRTLSSIVQ
jgi:hypothetical protein